MGVNPNGGQSHGSGWSAYYAPRCSATVWPSSRNAEPRWGGILISKRFGPYPAITDAVTALVQAGWNCEDHEGIICVADVGCQ